MDEKIKKRGFTYIEVMMALAVFLMLSAFVIRLNVEANRNMNMQIQRQNMMMEAQKCVEEIKSDPTKYSDSTYKVKDGYNVSQLAQKISTEQDIDLFEITVKVKSIDDSGDPVSLSTHFLFQSDESGN